MAIIMFMGKVSGAHLNLSVSWPLASRRLPMAPRARIHRRAARRRDARWLFLPGGNRCLWDLWLDLPRDAATQRKTRFSWKLVLTLGLVSVILGTASGAQNMGIFGAIGIGAYITLAGLWGSPISGASMNPARTFGPDLVGKDFTDYWVYVAGPLLGPSRGRAQPGRSVERRRARQLGRSTGQHRTEVQHPDKP